MCARVSSPPRQGDVSRLSAEEAETLELYGSHAVMGAVVPARFSEGPHSGVAFAGERLIEPGMILDSAGECHRWPPYSWTWGSRRTVSSIRRTAGVRWAPPRKWSTARAGSMIAGRVFATLVSEMPRSDRSLRSWTEGRRLNMRVYELMFIVDAWTSTTLAFARRWRRSAS
jgi:hypothetical protein